MEKILNINSNFTPQLNLNQPSEHDLRQQIKHYFQVTQDYYEQLFSCLTDKGFYVKPNPLRYPLIFYYGHTAVFYINKARLANILKKSVNKEFEQIFAVGVNETSWDDLTQDNQEWPSIATMRQYRRKVNSLIHQLIDDYPLSTPIHWNHPWWSLLMGIEHELIHLETSSVLFRQLSLSHITTPERFPIAPLQQSEISSNLLLPVSQGLVKIGRGQLQHYYGWDNEFGLNEINVAAFHASQTLVSNLEYLEFVNDAGYQNPHYWSKDGWQWLQYTNQALPIFWKKNDDHHYVLRCMLQEVVMPWNWPVVVNYYEAKAFCQWKSQRMGLKIRLPSEAQWQRLRDSVNPDESYWQAMNANLNLSHFASEAPVDMFKMGDFYDVIGNVWQWTETLFYPLSGFNPHPLYLDFSIPSFGQHNLMKGGSFATMGGLAGYYARNAFMKHFHQQAGFRYVSEDC